MVSSMVGNSSSRSTIAFMRGSIVIAFDATKSHNIQEFKDIISNVLMRDDMIQQTDTIIVLGVLHKVLHPMGFQIKVGLESFVGAHLHAIKEEVSRKIDAYVGMLQHSAEECEGKGGVIEVKIVVGAPIKKVVLQEIVALNPTWVILDRQLRKELRFYLQHIPCKVAHVHDNLSLEVLRPYFLDRSTKTTKHELLYSLSKVVLPPPPPDNESDKDCIISLSLSSPNPDIPENGLMPLSSYSNEERIFLQDEFGSNHRQEVSGSNNKLGNKKLNSPQVMQNERSLQNHSEVPVLSTASEMKTGQDAVGCSYSDIQITSDEISSVNSPEKGINAQMESKHDDSLPVIQRQRSLKIYPNVSVLCITDKMEMGSDSMIFTYSMIKNATDDFSPDNLLGEGGYGVVFKGRLKDGKLIAVKVRKEANTQCSAKLHSEIYCRTIAHNKNIEMLLGYCCKDNLSILVYEYACNKSLHWHLFDDAEHVIEWHRRHAIAIGTAKGLQFLHEECKGSPLIHQDIRPCNILLTQDFVPLLGDCGLAKWKKNKYDLQTRNIHNLVYLAPEYAESGICSVKTDVYALGIVLIQLISGRKAVNSTKVDHQQSLRQWALSLIQTLSFDELVDPRLGNSYPAYELYNMARAAYLCVQTKPAMRPTTGEVLRLLEGTNDHLRHLNSNLYPLIICTEASLS